MSDASLFEIGISGRRFTETPYNSSILRTLQQFGDLNGVQRRAFEQLIA